MSDPALRVVGLLVALVLLTGPGARGEAQSPSGPPELRVFFETMAVDDDVAQAALDRIEATWHPGYAGLLWDLVRFTQPPREERPLSFGAPGNLDRGAITQLAPEEHPTTKVWRRLMSFFEDRTGLRLNRGLEDLERVQQWMWEQPYEPHPDYVEFKATWYSQIDPRFQLFFPVGTRSLIRLDEIDWGGVTVNGIPPLEYPTVVAADSDEAEYLDDDHVVFGVAAGGEARAYPKRILAWHEMAIDRLGGVELTVVYCTLCGTVIPFESVVGGRHVRFGTSGLLYRSNKLMFDHETRSLWNTFEGVPVVGPLVGSGLQATHRSVVTTTWGEWRRMHPDTTVLSVETGHERNYGEGVAYRDYFNTDRLMFAVPDRDDPSDLDNKDEVLTLLANDDSGWRQPLAISADYLEDHRVFHTDHVGRSLVVLTTREGANRVYDVGTVRFARLVERDLEVEDETGRRWRVTEDALRPVEGEGPTLPRVAAQRAFWFGWYAQFPDTQLIE